MLTNRRPGLVGNAARATVAGFNTLLLAVLLVIAERVLGEEKYGKYSFALALAMLFGTVIELELKEIPTREVARNRPAGRPGGPFVAAKQPYLSPERGLLRALPVELTIVDDLPMALDQSRRRIAYGSDPELPLSMLDRNVHRSGKLDMWVAGSSRTDIVVRSGHPVVDGGGTSLAGREPTSPGSRLGSCWSRQASTCEAVGAICCGSERVQGSFQAFLLRAHATSASSA